MSAMGSIKLIYFDARGVLEATRYMLAISQTPYEDFRYKLGEDFSKPEFDAAKEAGEFRVNLDRLPILDYQGTQVPFICKYFDFSQYL